MASDNASAEVLGQSAPWLFDQVRLYFRPRTPTFWHNEGIRPTAFRSYGAHCPMPVALLFDSKAIAGRIGVQFSDGNLASTSARLGEDVSFLRSLDFREIYHLGPMSPELTRRLTARTQAEIIVPGDLGLDALRLVVTRSNPERQTLLTLLSEAASVHAAAPEEILVDSDLFHCRWTYVEHVALVSDQVRFLFNFDSQTPGPFAARFTWMNPNTGASTVTTESLRGIGHVNLPVQEGFRGSSVRLTVHLDNALAFSGTLDQVPSSTLLRTR